jgi:hypothetical protein
VPTNKGDEMLCILGYISSQNYCEDVDPFTNLTTLYLDYWMCEKRDAICCWKNYGNSEDTFCGATRN